MDFSLIHLNAISSFHHTGVAQLRVISRFAVTPSFRTYDLKIKHSKGTDKEGVKGKSWG
jgi:hypothetical protein